MERRVAVVTGAGGGIGSVIVREFLKRGIEVAAVDLKEITQAEESQRTVGLSWYRCDVSQKKDVDNLVDEVRENFRRIDILVNTAGITDRTPFLSSAKKLGTRC